jgi:hypothetical protein
MAMKTKGMFRPDRRIFVSWKQDGDADYTTWTSRLLALVLSRAGPASGRFESPLQTEDKKTLEVVLVRDWVDGLLGKGPARNIVKESPITDVISVCTVTYLNANMYEKAESPEEFAELIEKNVNSPTDRVRFWLAPIEPPDWASYKIRKIALDDRNGQYRAWLIRTRKDKRFPLPNVDKNWRDAVNELVSLVIGDSEKKST